MRERIILILLCVMTWSGVFAQQMPEISLFDQNQTVYNPGAMGNQEVLTANFLYRKNWATFVSGSPSTEFFCAHAPLKNPNVAIGILLEHDGMGSKNNTGAYFNYTYRINLGMNKLSFGLKGGVTNVSLRAARLRDISDPLFSEANLSYTLPNFGFGVSYYGQKYWAGISVPRMFAFENDGPEKFKMVHHFENYECFISGGKTFELNPDFSIDPSLLLILSKSYETRFAVNALATYKHSYSAGLGYRTGGDLIFIIEYNLNRQFSIGYSYDLELGEMADYSSGSHEINISYKFGYRVNAANPRGF
jgi:type IX secretion system PorP/SprF family membrane protein